MQYGLVISTVQYVTIKFIVLVYCLLAGTCKKKFAVKIFHHLSPAASRHRSAPATSVRPSTCHHNLSSSTPRSRLLSSLQYSSARLFWLVFLPTSPAPACFCFPYYNMSATHGSRESSPLSSVPASFDMLPSSHLNTFAMNPDGTNNRTDESSINDLVSISTPPKRHREQTSFVLVSPDGVLNTKQVNKGCPEFWECVHCCNKTNPRRYKLSSEISPCLKHLRNKHRIVESITRKQTKIDRLQSSMPLEQQEKLNQVD